MTLRIRNSGGPESLELTDEPRREEDGWGARLAKLIPAEALGLYGAAVALVPPVSGTLPAAHRNIALWGVVVVCLGFSAAIRWKATANSSAPQFPAIAISLVSFLIWLMALGAPTSPIVLPIGYGFVGPLVAMLWAGIASYFYRGDAT